jgi:hypothetical protein
MGERNRFGLGRTIPAEIKLEVRKRCGFDCVRCGIGFYDYEHFAPDFKNATTHDPAGITLLCMQCNQSEQEANCQRKPLHMPMHHRDACKKVSLVKNGGLVMIPSK